MPPAHGIQHAGRFGQGLHHALANEVEHGQHQGQQGGGQRGQAEQRLARALAGFGAQAHGVLQLHVSQSHDGIHVRHVAFGKLRGTEDEAPIAQPDALDLGEQLRSVREVALLHRCVGGDNLGRGLRRLDPQVQHVAQLIDAALDLVDLRPLGLREGLAAGQGRCEQGTEQPRVLAQVGRHARAPDRAGQGWVGLVGVVCEHRRRGGQARHEVDHGLHRGADVLGRSLLSRPRGQGVDPVSGQPKRRDQRFSFDLRALTPTRRGRTLFALHQRQVVGESGIGAFSGQPQPLAQGRIAGHGQVAQDGVGRPPLARHHLRGHQHHAQVFDRQQGALGPLVLLPADAGEAGHAPQHDDHQTDRQQAEPRTQRQSVLNVQC